MMKCKLKKISPTALNTFYKSPKRFVDTYVLGGTRMGQTKPMAIGSAFDVYIKAALLDWTSDEFEKEFVRSVESQFRSWARVEGANVLKMYQDSGAYNNLLTEIRGAEIFCEFKTTHSLKYEDGFEVPIGGIPDLMFLRNDMGIIVDWKVTGFMSKAFPVHGYVSLYKDGFNLGSHKDITPMRNNGILLGLGANVREDWMTQLTMYTWAALPKDCQAIMGIDQLVFKNVTGHYAEGGEQELRVAVFRLEVNDEFQNDLRIKLRKAWEMISSGHYYSNMTREDNDAQLEFLETADEETLWALRNAY